MRRVLLAAILLTPATAGCLDGGGFDFDGLRNDLEAKDEFEDRILLTEKVPFTPAGIATADDTPSGPDDVSSSWETSVAVPNGTRSLTVKFVINFTNPDVSEPLPVNPPDGEVNVYIEGPGGTERNLTRTESATAGFDFVSPQEGDWTLGLQARGNGTAQFTLRGIVPVGAPAG